MYDEKPGTLRESVVDDIFAEKFNSITAQIAMLCKKLEELDKLADEYMKIEKSKIGVNDDILPVINDNERDLLESALAFLKEYEDLYGYIPEVENVFSPADNDEINNRLSELDESIQNEKDEI